MPGKRWFADDYRDAVWESTSLKPNERLVAVTYADHAKDKHVAWVTWERLSQRTGIRAKTSISRAIQGLVAAGWMKQIEKPRQHRSPRYELMIPAADVRAVYDVADSEVAEMDICEDDETPDLATPEVAEMDNWSSPEVAERSPEVAERSVRGSGALPDYSDDYSKQTSPRVDPSLTTSAMYGGEDEDPVRRKVAELRLVVANGRRTTG